MKSKFIILSSILMFNFITLFAAPPHPDLLKNKQFMERYKNQVLNYFFNKKSKFAPAQTDKSKVLKAPSSGTHRLIIIKVDFPNKTDGATNVSSKFIGSSNSLVDYYDKASYGKLHIDVSEADIYPSPTGWYRAAHSYESYGGTIDEAGAENLVREAVNLADNDGVNFANYDFDGNGIVDHLLVLHSGNDEAMTDNTDDIWSHQTEISSISKDGKLINSYAIFAVTSPLGIICHEFGHELGMVDLYNTDDGSSAIGRWDVMDYGLWIDGGDHPCFPSVWHMALLGWINPIVINSPQLNYQLPNIEDSSVAIKIAIPVADSNSEYYLISNTQRKSYDAYLPGSGLLIWHIDDSVGSLASNNVNNIKNHLRVDLVEADGTDAGVTRGGSANTWKDNVNGFGPYSYPAARAYNNNLVADTIVHHIGISAETMSFNIFSSTFVAINVLDSNYITTSDTPWLLRWNYDGDTNLINWLKITNSQNNFSTTYTVEKIETSKSIYLYPGENSITIDAIGSGGKKVAYKLLKVYYYLNSIKIDAAVTAYSFFNSSDLISIDTHLAADTFIKINFRDDIESRGIILNKPNTLSSAKFGFENNISTVGNRKGTFVSEITDTGVNLNLHIKLNPYFNYSNGIPSEIFTNSKQSIFDIKATDTATNTLKRDVNVLFKIYFDTFLYTTEKTEWNLFYFDESDNVWKKLNLIESGENYITVSSNHLTTLGLFKCSGTGLFGSEIIAYPNPYIRGSATQSAAGIYFRDTNYSGLDGSEHIKIFTITGQKIFDANVSSLKKDSSNKYYWDLKDRDGDEVSSGIYLVYIEGAVKYYTKVCVIK